MFLSIHVTVHIQKRNIPYCLARRIATIISDNTRRTKRFAELTFDLKKCGYPEELIKDAINKFRNSNSRELKSSIK